MLKIAANTSEEKFICKAQICDTAVNNTVNKIGNNERVKASFTVENAVIVPVFTMLILAICSMAVYIHDKIILKEALECCAVELEMSNKINDTFIENLEEKVSRYVNEKSVFLSGITITITNDDKKISIRGEGRSNLAAMIAADDELEIELKREKNNPSNLIRITNGLCELKNKLFEK